MMELFEATVDILRAQERSKSLEIVSFLLTPSSKKPKREKQPAEDAPQEADAESQGEAVTKEVTSHD